MATAVGTRASLPAANDDGARSGGESGDVLRKAVARQEEQLRAAQTKHGEFDASVSEDLAQLALLYIMRGEMERALPLLHRRLVIHEKFGPEELVGEALQELGTVYRLHGTPEVARQHLTRALAIRRKCHGDQSLKAAETLNSLALVHQTQSDASTAKELQLQSLQVLYYNTEPEDMESEDVPWEVFKRLKRQRGPSTAANSVVLYKGNLRKAVTDALFKGVSDDPATRTGSQSASAEARSDGQDERAIGQASGVSRDGSTAGVSADSAPNADPGEMRTLRSKSDSAVRANADSQGGDRDLVGSARIGAVVSSDKHGNEDNLSSDRGGLTGRQLPRSLHDASGVSRQNQHQLQPILDFATMQQRVEHLKRRIAAGLPDSDNEIAQLASDVACIASPELQLVGDAMLSLVRELHRLRVRSDAARQLPVLEGVLEKKSASIFRGWEKRWFKVDPKTFVLSYHFSKDDDARGFAPRGGFAISRIASILVHRHARGSFFHFDVVVDLSTRSNPHGSRTYELRCEDEETLRYWVDTLHYYKTIAQASPPRPSTG